MNRLTVLVIHHMEMTKTGRRKNGKAVNRTVSNYRQWNLDVGVAEGEEVQRVCVPNVAKNFTGYIQLAFFALRRMAFRGCWPVAISML